MKESTLLCLPDISGFTKFMSEVDHGLASNVIPSLLNEIIYSNDIGLEVSEIEGDAVFFFKRGKLPKFTELLEQCFSFHNEFYEKLNTLQEKYKSNNQSDKIPEMLGLKIILHFSDSIGLTQIGNRIKLMGEDVIIAHKLLKNSIQENEYLLISEALLDQYSDEIGSEMDASHFFENSKEKYEHIDEVRYKYLLFPGN